MCDIFFAAPINFTELRNSSKSLSILFIFLHLIECALSLADIRIPCEKNTQLVGCYTQLFSVYTEVMEVYTQLFSVYTEVLGV